MTTQKESEGFADIDRIFAPRNIAIVGVSSEGFGFGRGMLLSHIAIGCKCKMYPVNQKGGSIAGMTIYPSIEDIPDTIATTTKAASQGGRTFIASHGSAWSALGRWGLIWNVYIPVIPIARENAMTVNPEATMLHFAAPSL